MYLYNVLTLVLVTRTVAGVRDFYAGWFNEHDLLIAQDTLYKERAYYRTVTAHYSREFKCPISYYRVMDRLGVGRGPRTEIVKGGLLKNFLVLRITSAFNYPVSVNIYIACANRKGAGPMFTTQRWTRDPKKTTNPKTSTKQSNTTQTSAPTKDATSIDSSVATANNTEGATTITEAENSTAADATTENAAEETTTEPKKILRAEVTTIEAINGEPETNTTNEEAPIIVVGRVEGLNSIGE